MKNTKKFGYVEPSDYFPKEAMEILEKASKEKERKDALAEEVKKRDKEALKSLFKNKK